MNNHLGRVGVGGGGGVGGGVCSNLTEIFTFISERVVWKEQK